MATARSFRIELSTKCDKCDLPVHINAAASEKACSECGAPLPLDSDFWHGALIDWIVELTPLAPGETFHRKRISARGETKVTFERTDPVCSACQQPLPPLEPGDLAGHVYCPACGAPSSARKTPDWLLALHPAVAGLVGEELDGEAAAEKPATSEGVTIHCMSCGANLPVDGSTREVRCTFCNGDNFLPDAIWQRLHPVAVVRPWFVLLDFGGGVGVLPEVHSDQPVHGIAVDAAGELVICHSDVFEDSTCVAGATTSGMISWQLDVAGPAKVAALPNGRYMALHMKKGDTIALVDLAERRVAGTFDSQLEHIAVDIDGTILGVREGRPTKLVRFRGDGTEIDVWPPAPPPPPQPEHKAGFFSRVFGDSQPASTAPPPPDWAALPPRVVDLPDCPLITVDASGRLFLVDRRLEHIAVYDRQGQLLAATVPRPLPDARLEDIGADAQGTLFALVRVGDHAEVLRMPAGGRLEPWLGPLSGRGPIGERDDKLAVSADGSLFTCEDFDSLRCFDAAGNPAWRSRATIAKDAGK